MYRWMLTSAVLLWFAAAPAVADVNVKVDYTKTKDITVSETITIDKTINITVDLTNATYDQAAEAEALINQENFDNKACTNCAEKRDRIKDSFNKNDGVVSANQSTGNMNNQATAVAISVDTPVEPTPENGSTLKESTAFANAQAAVEQDNGIECEDDTTPVGSVDQIRDCCWGEGNIQDSTNVEEKSALIAGSLQGNKGVANLNQASGNMANQANSLAMAVGFGTGGSALAEADLGQSNMYNMVFESQSRKSKVGAVKWVKINDSLINNAGVIGVNQSSGYMSNQANVTAFAVVVAGSAD